MAEVPVTFNLTVTPDSNAQTGYLWEYSVGQGSLQPLSGATLFKVGVGDTMSVTMNIQAGQTGDTCVFQNPQLPNPQDPSENQLTPLTVYSDWRQISGQYMTPEWLQNLTPSLTVPPVPNPNSTITFIDGNMNQEQRPYYFVINAVYTPQGQTAGTPITSPEPTIVNAATDGTSIPILPCDGSHVRQESTAVAA